MKREKAYVDARRKSILELLRENPTAEAILKKYPGKRMAEIAEEEGLSVALVEKDAVNQVFRTFGEYDTASGQMTLYLASIVKWARANGLSEETARELVMAHEFYHFLQRIFQYKLFHMQERRNFPA